MKPMQKLLRHRMVPNKARAALRQMCVWVKPEDSDYTASYDPLVAKWTAFEKDMADVRSQKEGPLRWNPPSYKNDAFLLLQKNQHSKPITRGLRKQNSNTFYHRPTSHRVAGHDAPDAHTKQNFQKKTPDGASIQNKRQEIEEEEQMPQRSSSSVDTPRRRVQEREASLRGHPTEIEAHERREITTELAIQDSLTREVPLEDVTVKEVSQKLAKPLVVVGPAKKMPPKNSSWHRTLVKSRRQEYENEDGMHQKVLSSMDMPRRRAPLRETLFKGNQSGADSSGAAATFMESTAKEISSREVPLKDFTVTAESFEETEKGLSLRDVPVKRMLSREASKNVDSVKEVADSEPLVPEGPEKSQEQLANATSRDTSTYVYSAQEEPDERDLAQEISEEIDAKKPPLQEAPRKRTILRERLEDTSKRSTKKTSLKRVPSGEEPVKKASVTHAIHKSATNSMREVNDSEYRGHQKKENKSANVYSSFEGSYSRNLNDDILLTPIADEGMMKESTTFSKKKYEALRKYIAEAEVELRVQKQMLNMQKEDFKRRMRKMALNPLAEIERNSKVHLQNPLDYFNQKNKILLAGKKNQKKVRDEANINSTSHSHSKSNESIPAQSKLQERSEEIISKETNNMITVEDEMIAEPNPPSMKIPPHLHQGKENILEGRFLNKTAIQGRSKEILDTLSDVVESTGLPYRNRASKKILKQGKNQIRENRSNIRLENSDNIEVGKSQHEGIIDLKISSEEMRPSKNIDQTLNRNSSKNLELSALQEMSTRVRVGPDRVTGSNVTRSRPSSKERYDYFAGEQLSVLSSNQLNPQNSVKRKIATESYSDKSITDEGNQEMTQRRSKLHNNPIATDTQPAIVPVHTGHEGPPSQENNNYNSVDSREMQKNTQEEIYRNVGDVSELKNQKGTGVNTTIQVGRASSLLDRSKAKLRKHFMDRSAPIRLNKNAAYIYHPSESTISTLTKTTLDTVVDSEIPPIPVLSTFTRPTNQATLEGNVVKDPSNQENQPFLTSPSELIFVPEQPLTKEQKSPERNSSLDQTEDAPSERWDDAISPMNINLMPADDSATSKILLQKDNSTRQTQNDINVKQKRKFSSIPATSKKNKTKYQEDNINNLVYTDAYPSSSRNKPTPEYNYFSTSGVETRSNVKDIILNSKAKQYPGQQKAKLITGNELSVSGQTTAPEKYDSLPEGSESSSNTLKIQLDKVSKTDNLKYKQIRAGGVSISPESFLSNIPNYYQPVSSHSGRINSEYYLSKDFINLPETNLPEIQTYNQKMFSVADNTNAHLHRNKINTGSNNPEIDYNTMVNSDKSEFKQNARSLDKLYPSLQTTDDSFISNDVSDTSAGTKRSNLSETYINDYNQKSVKSTFANESNNRGSEAIETLQDIEEGIPSSRVNLRPPFDAFSSFGVGKVDSESELSSNPYLRLQSSSTNPESIVAASKSQSVRSHSLPSKPFFKVNIPKDGNASKNTSGSTGQTRFRSHSSIRSNSTELSQPRTSRRIRDRYPTLFKHDQNSDLFNEIFPSTYEKSECSYKKISSSIPIKSATNSQDSKFKKSSRENKKTGSTMFNKSIAPVVRENTRFWQEKFDEDRFEQAKPIPPNEWPDQVTQPKDFIESTTCGYSTPHHKSYRFDPPKQTQSGVISSDQEPLDRPTKIYSPTKDIDNPNLTSDTPFSSSPRTAQYIDSTDAAITFNKSKPVLFEKPDLLKTKFRPRFISPPSYDVENVDSFFSVDESIQLPGSPIRKWKVAPKERGRAVYVASIPQNRTSP